MKLTLRKGNTLIAAVMLVAILFGFMPAPQPVHAVSTCDWVQFVADITVQDGTNFTAGATFNKTWRLKNIGTCTWTTNYSLVFVDGTSMGAASSTKLPSNVAPGNTIDLTLAMTAPSTAGTYRGNFQMKNASNTQFGLGANANKSFWVEIRVGGNTGGTGYDFVANAPSAAWTSGAGTLPFPGIEGDSYGFGKKLDAPVLENGATDTAPGLLMIPQNVYGGFIQAQYPAISVKNGDTFQSIINCEYNATACYVNFRLNYQIGSGAVQTFWSFNERYEGLFYRANLDLSSLAGQDVKFILFVGAAGYANGDRALWGAPKIVSSGGVTPTITPTPVVVKTATPAPSGCTDRATFINDKNVPDGTVFTPSATFTKTWTIKNTGTCTWTTDYSLVFVSGDQMGGPASTKLTSTVGPNTSFDVSVNLTAPASAGSYRGYWQFKNKNAALFGIGYLADKAWWVDIVVRTGVAPTATSTPSSSIATATPGAAPTVTSTPAPSGVMYDFAANATSATWTSGAGVITFPTTSGANGYAFKTTSIQMEDSVSGSLETRPSLLTFPQAVDDGYIQGVFVVPGAINSGDRFMVTTGCEYGFGDCYVTYRLAYQIGSGTVTTLWDFVERYEGLTYNATVDLSSLAGNSNVKFILKIMATGTSVGDRAVWVAPRITR